MSTPSFTRRIILAVATLAAVAGTVGYLSRAPRVESVAAVRRDVIQTVVGSGRVLMAGDVALSAKRSSTVLSLGVKEGQHVEAGQWLVKLDDTDSRAALAEAQASVMRSLVEVRSIRQKAAPLAQVSLRRAEVDVQYAEQALSRTQKLFAAGALSPQQLEQTAQALALATTRRDAAQVELTNTLPAGADRELAAAAMQQAQAALQRAEAALAESALVAAAAGTVVEINVDPGDSVQPGALLVRMVLDGPVQLEMEPDERNLALLRLGQAARASAEAYPDKSFDARLSYIAQAVDADRGTIRVRFELSAPPDYLRADMTVSIEVTVAQVPRALVVPAAAVRDLASKAPWLLVATKGHASRRNVTIGARDESMVEVKSRLTEGELVLLDAELAPDSRVHATERKR